MERSGSSFCDSRFTRVKKPAGSRAIAQTQHFEMAERHGSRRRAGLDAIDTLGPKDPERALSPPPASPQEAQVRVALPPTPTAGDVGAPEDAPAQGRTESQASFDVAEDPASSLQAVPEVFVVDVSGPVEPVRPGTAPPAVHHTASQRPSGIKTTSQDGSDVKGETGPASPPYLPASTAHPTLKAFVHAIEAGQRMWELAHPSVVIQRKDAETNGDLAEESEDERRRITKPKAEKPKRELHSGVYLGLEVEFDPYPHFCVYVHDGFFAIDYFVERVPLTGVGYDNSDGSLHPAPSFSSLLAQTTSHILSWLHHYSLASGHKLFACGFSLRAHPLSSHSNHLALSKPGRMSDLQVVDMRGGRNYPMRLPSLLWRELDVLPIVVQTQGETVEERAASACRKMLTFVTASAIGPIPRIQLTPTHSVQVDLNSRIHLVDLQDYEHLSSAETWSSLIRMANEVRAAKIRIAWFNSTAQGGGVALMRHALMRILKKLGVDAKWFVMKPDPKVYDITKRRFHNTLQGVSHERLTQQDKELYERWGRTNFEKYFRTELMETDVVVLDDPQVLCMLPHIKKLVPSAKIIFRCHIEIRTDLLLDPTAPISETWSYLWSFARHADLFVFHPVARFIPPEVPRERCVVMCPTTDPLDGLNKPLPAVEIDFYIHMLNRIAYDQCHRRLDRDRNYIVQVARFDPSKGIPELLESYRVLRERLYARNWPLAKTPQLLICGHGSVDDPDGMLIFHQVIEKMKSEPFKKISRDIVTARLPPSDQLLNAAVAGSLFACQLSQREGFEVKVTEALHHGKPVLVTAVGGIPHQVTNGRNGFIVPFRDVDMAAARMERLIVDERLRDAMGSQAQKCVNEEFWTPLVSINWLYMAQGLVEGTLLDKVKDTYRANVAASAQGVRPADPLGESASSPTKLGAIGGRPFDFDHAETEAELHDRRTAMAGDSPWIVRLWQAELLGEDLRTQTRCLQTADAVREEAEELWARGRTAVRKEFGRDLFECAAKERREKSWDAISVRSEVSDWGSVQDPERAQMEA